MADRQIVAVEGLVSLNRDETYSMNHIMTSAKQISIVAHPRPSSQTANIDDTAGFDSNFCCDSNASVISDAATVPAVAMETPDVIIDSPDLKSNNITSEFWSKRFDEVASLPGKYGGMYHYRSRR